MRHLGVCAVLVCGWLAGCFVPVGQELAPDAGLACTDDVGCAPDAAPVPVPECVVDDECAGRICDGGVCRACASDGECASGACDQTAGECVAVAEVAYVDPSGQGMACSDAAPCGLSAALAQHATGRHVVVLAPGRYAVNVEVPLAGELALHGPAEAIVVSALADTSTITNAGHLTVSGLTIERHEQAATSTVAIGCSNVSVTLWAATVDRVRATDCDVTMTGGRAHSIAVTRGTLRAQAIRTGSVSLTDAGFDIRHSIIAGGGGTGVWLRDLDAGSPPLRRFAFNTVAHTVDSIAPAREVLCQNVAVAVELVASIFASPRGIEAGGKLLDGANCTATSSLFSQPGLVIAPGTGNRVGDAKFVDTVLTSALGFHIAADSAARDVVVAAPGEVDIDGEARCVGGMCEAGADELP